MSEDRIELQAGPLTMTFDPVAGWLRRVRLGRREVLRAIYPAVRDRFWNTLPTRLSNLRVEPAPGGFRVAFDAECRRGPIHFVFRGDITGTADGTVTYHFDGLARSTFLKNRIGLCVLHPAECAGRRCDLEHTDGRVESRHFPADIAPHQPFHELRGITHEVSPGVAAEVCFAGEVFETEDQRNWTDASFKTYPTPLRRPFPVEVPVGMSIRQSVTLRVHGDPAREAPEAEPVPTIQWGGGAVTQLPRLGFGMANRPLTGIEVSRLRALKPHHLRLDLPTTTLEAGDQLRQAAAQAETVGAKLEVALLLGAEPEVELAALAGRLPNPLPVYAWLLSRGLTGPATAGDVALARQHLARVAPGAAVGVGSNLYFTQVNRERPPVEAADWLGFSVNPQVHAFDDESLVETLAGQTEVVRNARRLAAGRPAVVTPVTLRPRFNPNGELPDAEREPGEPPDAVDPRQSSAFCAAWTLASVRRLAEAGAASATYYETAGPGGLMDEGEVFPVYHVFADLAEFGSGTVDVCRCSAPLVVEAIRLVGDRGSVPLVANLTNRRQRVTLLSEAGAPVRGRARIPGGATGRPFDGVLELKPFAFARIEAGSGV